MRVLIVLSAIAMLVGACTPAEKSGGPAPVPAPPAAETAAGPGNPDVYARIAVLADCRALQEEFDTAMDNAEARRPGDRLRAISLAYADAADDRLRSLGCYD